MLYDSLFRKKLLEQNPDLALKFIAYLKGVAVAAAVKEKPVSRGQFKQELAAWKIVGVELGKESLRKINRNEITLAKSNEIFAAHNAQRPRFKAVGNDNSQGRKVGRPITTRMMLADQIIIMGLDEILNRLAKPAAVKVKQSQTTTRSQRPTA